MHRVRQPVAISHMLELPASCCAFACQLTSIWPPPSALQSVPAGLMRNQTAPERGDAAPSVSDAQRQGAAWLCIVHRGRHPGNPPQ
jgi:hypothetical protein